VKRLIRRDLRYTSETRRELTKGMVVALDESGNAVRDGVPRLLHASAGHGGVLQQLVQAPRHHAEHKQS
jgi:hypothetical protein